MGKYILEVLVIVLLGLFLAPFVIGGLRRITKRYTKLVDETMKEEKEDDRKNTKAN